jgi:AraC-like DNA-binding protein
LEVDQLPAFEAGHLPVPQALDAFVDALVWARIGAARQSSVSPLMPHGGLLLVVSMAAGANADAARSTQPRAVTSMVARRLCDSGTTLRTHTSGCDTLFALLKPRGALRLMHDVRLGDTALTAAAPTDARMALRALVGRAQAERLRADIEQAAGARDALPALARWLEALCIESPQREPAGVAQLLSLMDADPAASLEQLRDAVGMGRRSVERHVQAWFGTTPKQQQRFVRLQHSGRLAWQQRRAAEIAFELGFADQPHFSRTVTQLTGMTARRFMDRMDTVLARAFREATGGANLMPCAFEPEPVQAPEPLSERLRDAA